ncbi:MAG TPA: aminoglycoside phosphotransferase family protein [Gaiellaceae bacterium]|nr:aminoglycoside phosphotransferase family protein [Gaiellaceae bacterium]
MRVPAGLDWWRGEPGGAAWLGALPSLVSACAERWELTLADPFEPARISLVVPATLRSGERAVLKLNFPEPESEREPDALTHWQGNGAVRLLARDDERRALLLERCGPGTQLWATGDEDAANLIAAGVLRLLRRQPSDPHPYRLLAVEAERWAEELPRRWRALGRPFERALLDEAVSACRELGPGPTAASVLHQDLHGGNVLRADDGWLAIDPKPLVGDPAFDAASLLRDRRWLLTQPGARSRVRRRLDLLTAELELDRERARRWGIAHALAWGVDEPGADEAMVESARLLAAAS